MDASYSRGMIRRAGYSPHRVYDCAWRDRKTGDIPAAVAFPVNIFTWDSSSDILLCASSPMAGCVCDKSAPH